MTYTGLSTQNLTNHPEAHAGGNIIEGDPFTFSPLVWDYMINRFALSSVLDLGAGRAYSSQYFFRAGLQVIAVDGLKSNCELSAYPSLHIDLTQTSVHCRVDLVHCQEVVEHIEEQYIDNLLRSLTCGKFILMTNALPGQGGHHHVNEQPTEYWIEHLQRYSCSILVEDSNRIRQLAAKDGAAYLARTGLIAVNHSRL